jgi:hypothetical protein
MFGEFQAHAHSTVSKGPLVLGNLTSNNFKSPVSLHPVNMVNTTAFCTSSCNVGFVFASLNMSSTSLQLLKIVAAWQTYEVKEALV